MALLLRTAAARPVCSLVRAAAPAARPTSTHWLTGNEVHITRAAATHANAMAVGKLDASRCVLFVCDVQERFAPLIHRFDAVAHTSAQLLRGCNALGIPALVTEQYPKALGHTVPEVSSHVADGTPVLEKTLFSMVLPEVAQRFDAGGEWNGRDQVIICGIESHVCVMQTALDLAERGCEVHVVVDGVSSQRSEERQVALNRLNRIPGAFLCTWEMALFQLCGHAKHDAFKQISALAKEDRPRPMLCMDSAL
ncbi:hypothetical protein PPROV_000096900 [Pycnococcus provasolii]|uniref:Isochorismatase-like domain-containing protein n=1 Tax=Pycnococcus provasolii TaxID=41880 RepID=A0A830H6N1_9CHLO|nr:hypothetical protein PPROV_000096900 [Pycnococcus provasolii]